MDKIKSSPPRILHSPVNICGIGRSLADWQRDKKNATSDFIVFSDRTTFQNSHSSLELDGVNPVKRLYKKTSFFFSALKTYDVFHFYFGKSLLPLSIDLPILRLAGKRIVMDYVGSDIRLFNLHSKTNPYYNLRKPKSIWDHFDLAKRLKMIWQGLWIHVCFAGPVLYPHAATSIPSKKINKDLWINKTLIVPNKFPDKVYTKKPLIIHAPTDEHTKGTEYVLKAIEELKDSGENFDFKLYKDIPHDELIKILRDDADIVVDQLLSGGFGVLAMEAMSFGVPVCSFILPEIRDAIPGLPIVQSTIDTLKDNLHDLIQNSEKREQAGRDSWKFARSHFDRNRIYEALWQIYLSL